LRIGDARPPPLAVFGIALRSGAVPLVRLFFERNLEHRHPQAFGLKTGIVAEYIWNH
jgi:hypothetical protein